MSFNTIHTPCATPHKHTPAAHALAHYLAFGAAGALLTALEETRGCVPSPGCLDVRFGTPAQYMQIDAATVQARGGGLRAELGGACAAPHARMHRRALPIP